MTIFVIILIIIVIFAFLFRRKVKVPLFSTEPEKYVSIDDRYNSDKRDREKEIDLLLSKMGKNGINDLSEKDRKKLDELSKK